MDTYNENYSKVKKRFVYIVKLDITEIQELYDHADEIISNLRQNVRDRIVELEQADGHHIKNSMPDWYDESMLNEIIEDIPWAKNGIESAKDIQARIKEYVEQTDRFPAYDKSQLTFIEGESLGLTPEEKIKKFVSSKDSGIKKENHHKGEIVLNKAYSEGLHSANSNTTNADFIKEHLEEISDLPSKTTLYRWLNNFKNNSERIF
ncbi:hypothetical protein SAMN05443144_10297 [Fodinibius roseus]|uniref:Uncharacterized protein n=1 Tax=Fodinibius roseus TaxID=1194090 RepID=A0A1M4UPV4_9BACT|nr:hypothetical protein [Fodinibius roseus]SHE58781.1 hypothetical protein SAMN05443144_10297 [Fodinibius roseus]